MAPGDIQQPRDASTLACIWPEAFEHVPLQLACDSHNEGISKSDSDAGPARRDITLCPGMRPCSW